MVIVILLSLAIGGAYAATSFPSTAYPTAFPSTSYPSQQPTALAMPPDTLAATCNPVTVRASASAYAACEAACAPAAHCEANPAGTCLFYAPCVILRETGGGGEASSTTSCQELGITTQQVLEGEDRFRCGTSHVPECGVPERHAGGTWQNVLQRCITLGARLCTLDELQSGCASGTGGGYDKEHVWSSTSCGDGPGSYYAFRWVKEGQTLETRTSGKSCEPGDREGIYTRCCADPPECAANSPDVGRPCSVKGCSSLDWLQGTAAVYGKLDKDARFQYTCGGSGWAEGVRSWGRRPDTGTDVCGGTNFPDCTSKCHGAETAARAADLCANAKMRLCSAVELERGIVSDATDAQHGGTCDGGGLDAQDVWSSTPCETAPAAPGDGGGGTVPGFEVVRFATQSKRCVAATTAATAAVRCCLDYRTGSPTTSPTKAPTQEPTAAALPTFEPSASPTRYPTASPTPPRIVAATETLSGFPATQAVVDAFVDVIAGVTGVDTGNLRVTWAPARRRRLRRLDEGSAAPPVLGVVVSVALDLAHVPGETFATEAEGRKWLREKLGEAATRFRAASEAPTNAPTKKPSAAPTTKTPTKAPTFAPSRTPTTATPSTVAAAIAPPGGTDITDDGGTIAEGTVVAVLAGVLAAAAAAACWVKRKSIRDWLGPSALRDVPLVVPPTGKGVDGAAAPSSKRFAAIPLTEAELTGPDVLTVGMRVETTFGGGDDQVGFRGTVTRADVRAGEYDVTYDADGEGEGEGEVEPALARRFIGLMPGEALCHACFTAYTRAFPELLETKHFKDYEAFRHQWHVMDPNMHGVLTRAEFKANAARQAGLAASDHSLSAIDHTFTVMDVEGNGRVDCFDLAFFRSLQTVEDGRFKAFRLQRSAALRDPRRPMPPTPAGRVRRRCLPSEAGGADLEEGGGSMGGGALDGSDGSVGSGSFRIKSGSEAHASPTQHVTGVGSVLLSGSSTRGRGGGEASLGGVALVLADDQAVDDDGGVKQQQRPHKHKHKKKKKKKKHVDTHVMKDHTHNTWSSQHANKAGFGSSSVARPVPSGIGSRSFGNSGPVHENDERPISTHRPTPVLLQGAIEKMTKQKKKGNRTNRTQFGEGHHKTTKVTSPHSQAAFGSSQSTHRGLRKKGASVWTREQSSK